MKYLILYGSCGHGHQRAAEYMAEELKRRNETDVNLVDFLTLTRPFCRKFYPLLYKFAVTRIPWLWGICFHITNIKALNWLVRIVRRIINSLNGPQLANFIIAQNPNIIVLTHFFPAEVACALKRQGKITSLIVTVVTDSIPHATWINRGTDYFIGLAEETKQALCSWGVAESIIRVLGIPIAPKFKLQGKKAFYRDKYGLDQTLFTVLITSGSFGMGPTKKIVELVSQHKGTAQLMVVCGNNQKLYDDLNAQTYAIPVKVFPFVDYMDELMEAADVVIAKSGGLTMCESLAKELPMIISRPIPGQETFNAHLLLAHDAAFKLNSVDDIKKLMHMIVHDKGVLATKKEHMRNLCKADSTKDIVDFLLTLKQ